MALGSVWKYKMMSLAEIKLNGQHVNLDFKINAMDYKSSFGKFYRFFLFFYILYPHSLYGNTIHA